MALSVLGRALERGDIAPGDRVVEYTGGSTGTSLAFVAAVLGLRFTAVFSDAFSDSKRQAMEAFGAEVLVEQSGDGTITPGLIQRMKTRAYALAEEPGTYYADQFGSPDVRAGYAPMGREIAATGSHGVDVFVAAVGTGAALMGTADGMAEAGLTPDLVALEPAQSAGRRDRRRLRTGDRRCHGLSADGMADRVGRRSSSGQRVSALLIWARTSSARKSPTPPRQSRPFRCH